MFHLFSTLLLRVLILLYPFFSICQEVFENFFKKISSRVDPLNRFVYSDRSALTGSILAAERDGTRPETSVNKILIETIMMA